MTHAPGSTPDRRKRAGEKERGKTARSWLSGRIKAMQDELAERRAAGPP